MWVHLAIEVNRVNNKSGYLSCKDLQLRPLGAAAGLLTQHALPALGLLRLGARLQAVAEIALEAGLPMLGHEVALSVTHAR